MKQRANMLSKKLKHSGPIEAIQTTNKIDKQTSANQLRIKTLLPYL